MPSACRYGGVALCALGALWAASAGAQDGLNEEQLELGRKVFTSAEPACRICHTLEDAGASGSIGPNLDNLQPNEGQVRLIVRGGAGSMPPYEGRLSEEEIDAVAAYVAAVAGQ